MALPANMFKAKWDSYADRCCPAKPGTNQYKQTQCAFYAGASVIMGAVNAAGELDVSDEAGVWLISTLQDELVAFMAAQFEEAKRHMKRRHESN